MLSVLHFGGTHGEAESSAHGRVGLGIELTRYWCAVSTFNIRITTKCEIIFHFLLGLVTRLDNWWARLLWLNSSHTFRNTIKWPSIVCLTRRSSNKFGKSLKEFAAGGPPYNFKMVIYKCAEYYDDDAWQYNMGRTRINLRCHGERLRRGQRDAAIVIMITYVAAWWDEMRCDRKGDAFRDEREPGTDFNYYYYC